jgi:hypothetical protein
MIETPIIMRQNINVDIDLNKYYDVILGTSLIDKATIDSCTNPLTRNFQNLINDLYNNNMWTTTEIMGLLSQMYTHFERLSDISRCNEIDETIEYFENLECQNEYEDDELDDIHDTHYSFHTPEPSYKTSVFTPPQTPLRRRDMSFCDEENEDIVDEDEDEDDGEHSVDDDTITTQEYYPSLCDISYLDTNQEQEINREEIQVQPRYLLSYPPNPVRRTINMFDFNIDEENERALHNEAVERITNGFEDFLIEQQGEDEEQVNNQYSVEINMRQDQQFQERVERLTSYYMQSFNRDRNDDDYYDMSYDDMSYDEEEGDISDEEERMVNTRVTPPPSPILVRRNGFTFNNHPQGGSPCSSISRALFP